MSFCKSSPSNSSEPSSQHNRIIIVVLPSSLPPSSFSQNHLLSLMATATGLCVHGIFSPCAYVPISLFTLFGAERKSYSQFFKKNWQEGYSNSMCQDMLIFSNGSMSKNVWNENYFRNRKTEAHTQRKKGAANYIYEKRGENIVSLFASDSYRYCSIVFQMTTIKMHTLTSVSIQCFYKKVCSNILNNSLAVDVLIKNLFWPANDLVSTFSFFLDAASKGEIGWNTNNCKVNA